ncbi:MAG TPA: ABC transporter permease [Bryobacteraceae bacterium]|nr:ABC transporter permease [Bryobacteraceae bacterium]
MRFIWISAWKDLLRLRREPVALLTWIAIPTFVVIILTLVFGPGGSRPHGTLFIADEDGGIGAGMLASAFSQGALGQMLTIEKVGAEAGRRRLDRGEGSALLIVPPGFTASFIAARPVTLDLVRNPSQRILPDMIQESLAIMLDRAASFQGAGGSQALQLVTNVIPDKSEQPGGFAALLLPGALFMAIFFIAGALAADVWRERSSGALRRIATTPASLGAFLAGKLLASALVFSVIGAFGLLVARQLMNLRIANLPAAVLWIAASGCALYLLIMIVQSAASSERVASMLTNFVTLPLVMLGGGFVPFEWMPRKLATIGQWTPNGWCVIELRAVLAGEMRITAAAIVAAFITAAWLIGVRNIRRLAC